MVVFSDARSPDRLRRFFADLGSCEDKGSATHGLHPYPAKFIPHIPRIVISELCVPGETVLDPMCGSGTTLVEAAAAGVMSVGLDINPIAALVSQAKTTRLSPASQARLRRFADQVACAVTPAEIAVSDFRNRRHWYDDGVAAAIAHLLTMISSLDQQDERTFARCALSAILVGVSRQDSETRWVRTDRVVAPAEVYRRFWRRLRESLERAEKYSQIASAPAAVSVADARSMPLADSSVSLIMTSPPYANSHDYYLYNKLRLFWLGYPVAPVQEAEFGSRNKHSDQKQPIGHYLDAMTGVIGESWRILRPGGYACLVVGDAVIRGEFFDMGILMPAVMRKVGFAGRGHYRFAQQKYTRAFYSGFGTAQPKQTHVVVMRKM